MTGPARRPQPAASAVKRPNVARDIPTTRVKKSADTVRNSPLPSWLISIAAAKRRSSAVSPRTAGTQRRLGKARHPLAQGPLVAALDEDAAGAVAGVARGRAVRLRPDPQVAGPGG